MKLYQFKPVTDENRINWDLMYQLNRTSSIPVPLNGFSQGYCWGHFVLDGPRVHIYLWLYGDPIWADDAYLKLPIAPLQLNLPTGKEDFWQHIGPFIDVSTGSPINSGKYYQVITAPDNQQHARLLLVNSGSVAGSATLNGTYLRK